MGTRAVVRGRWFWDTSGARDADRECRVGLTRFNGLIGRARLGTPGGENDDRERYLTTAKKLVTSSTNSAGCSKAAKWPPRAGSCQ